MRGKRGRQEQESAPFQYNSEVPYSEMRVGRRTGLYFGHCDPTKPRYGFFPDRSEYIDHRELQLKREQEEADDLLIPREPEGKEGDRLSGGTQQRAAQIVPESVSVRKCQTSLTGKQIGQTDKFGDGKDGKGEDRADVQLTVRKEEGRQMFLQTGQSDRREIADSSKDVVRGQVSNGKVADQLGYDLGATSTDFMRYLQKEEERPMQIEGTKLESLVKREAKEESRVVQEAKEQKKKKSKKTMGQSRPNLANPDRKQSLPKKRVRIMDKNEIKWPGESTTTSYMYVMPSHLATDPGRENRSEEEGKQKMMEVAVEYASIEDLQNPWQGQTVTMERPQKQSVKEIKPEKKKSRKKQVQPEQPNMQGKEPVKRKPRSKSSKASSKASKASSKPSKTSKPSKVSKSSKPKP